MLSMEGNACTGPKFRMPTEGRKMFCLVDTEGDCVLPGTVGRVPEPYFWHKYHLRVQGVLEAEVSERERCQLRLAKEYSAIKNQKTRQNRRPQFRQDSREKGLLTSDVFSI